MTQILVVDDHDVVRTGIKTLIKEMVGCEVCGEAANGQEAVEQVIKLKPDVVLLDVSMPGIGGIKAAKLIRRVAPKTTIVLLSMHDPVQLAHEASSAGILIDAYLNKTCVAKELKPAFISLGLLPKE